MRRGFSLAELAVVLAILGVVTAVTLPRLWGWLDWVAVDRAAVEFSTALAVARSAAGAGRMGGPSRLGGPTLAGPGQPSTAWRSKSRIPRSSSSPQGSLGASRTPAWCCGAGLTSPPLRCRGWAE